MKTIREGFKNLTRKFSYHVLNSFFFLNVCIIFCLNFAGFTCFLPSYGEKFRMNNWKSLFQSLVKVLMRKFSYHVLNFFQLFA